MHPPRPAQVWRLFQTSRLPQLASVYPAGVTAIPRCRYSTAVPNIASLLAPPSAASEGDILRVNGFVRSVRKQKKVAFVSLGDGSSLDALQVVLSPELAEGLSTGVAVAIAGKWKAAPSGKEQAHELHADQVRILGANSSASYPLQKKYHSPEFLRTIPHLRCRLPFNSLMLRMRSQVIANLTSYFAENDYVQTHPPTITSSDCEGAGEVFTIRPASDPEPGEEENANHFFRTQKYLTVSSQLHLEAFAQSVGKVWTLSPTFRAEKSDTPRHLSEFYMLEAELAFVEDANEIMDVVESMMRHITHKLAESRIGAELLSARSSRFTEQEESAISPEMLRRRWDSLIKGPWPRVTYASAIDSLREAALQGKVRFQYPPSYDAGLQAEHEKYLAEHLGNHGPIFITDYPKEIKPFYMAASTTATTRKTSTVACFDLLVPDLCEIVGGSMREHSLPVLLESMERHGLKVPPGYDVGSATGGTVEDAHMENGHPSDNQEASLNWYLDLRKYGSVPHGGFGLGFDRLLCYLSGVANIRDTVGFPRWHGRCDC